MEYFNLLEFKKEPFSNSPEPEFLFASPQHNTCLQRLELAVRLRRGLNIVIGAVGTGKTTLCRKLIQQLSIPAASDSPAIETFLLLDPAVESQFAFVKTVAAILGISDISGDDHEWQIKEKIKTFLFEQGIQNQKNIVLIIDEGQKIPDNCLEVLREFLNYETNSFKLLQIVIFAQPEFRKSLAARVNLLDRVNYLFYLQPLSFRQMMAMIEYRITVASQNPVRHPLFTFGGMLAVYIATAGYPRKVVSLCHHVLLMMIIRGKNKAGWFLVRNCANKKNRQVFSRVIWATLSLLVLAMLFFSTGYYLNGPKNNGGKILDQRILSGIGINKDSFHFPFEQKNSLKTSEKMPDYLGTITVRQRMTIWQILETIYGDASKEITQRLVEANPQMKNINSILTGTIIQVPSMPEKARPIKPDTIIVALENGKELEAIYYSFTEKKILTHMPDIRLLTFWNKREGQQFAIALDKRFKSMEAANDAIRRLPSALAGSAQVMKQWDGDTVLFNSRFL